MPWQHLSISAISQLLLVRFWPNFLNPFFGGHNLGPNIFFRPKICLDPKVFQPKIFSNIFSDPIFFLIITFQKQIFDPIFFLSKIFFCQRFLDPQFLWTQKFLDPGTQYLFGTWRLPSLSKLNTLDLSLVSSLAGLEVARQISSG